MWNAEDGYFWTGSNDGATINKSATQRPLDVQTWSWLAARQSRYAEALDWARTNLAVTDTPQRTNSALTGNYTVTGVAFGSGSLKADTETPIDQWHGNPDSGSGLVRGHRSARARAAGPQSARRPRQAPRSCWPPSSRPRASWAPGQTYNGKAIPGGIVAASSPMNTGFGFGYYQHLHVGATSWYVMAGTRTNPYVFL